MEVIQKKVQQAETVLRFSYLSMRFKLRIMSSSDTIDYIRKHQCSVARFGDGELNMILTDKSIGFQRYNKELSERLEEVLVSNDSKLLICIPHTLERFYGECQRAKSFWSKFAIYNKPSIYQILRQHNRTGCKFGDTQMTRPYMDYVDDKNARKVYPALKALWDKQDLLIVEGSATRMGVGNDLFDNAASVKRVVCPAKNAYAAYDLILKTVKDLHQGELVLIALGPAATVLAADLSQAGVWAIDVGHLDVEYEWFKSGTKQKSTIKGKYVNEVSGGDCVEESADIAYLSQIVARIQNEGE